MQREVLEQIETADLKAYAVWEPILRTDDERSSRKATTVFPDERVTHYWVDTRAVGKLFQAPIDLTGEPAWDVYLVYSPGVRWEEDTPPRPDTFMHQLGGRLPEENRLDAPKLAAALRKAVSRD